MCEATFASPCRDPDPRAGDAPVFGCARQRWPWSYGPLVDNLGFKVLGLFRLHTWPISWDTSVLCNQNVMKLPIISLRASSFPKSGCEHRSYVKRRHWKLTLLGFFKFFSHVRCCWISPAARALGEGRYVQLERVQPQPGAILPAQLLPRAGALPGDGGWRSPSPRRTPEHRRAALQSQQTHSSILGGRGTRSNMHNPAGKTPYVGWGAPGEGGGDRRGHRAVSQSWVPRCPAEMWPTGSVAWDKGAEEGFIGERSLRLSRGDGSAGTSSGGRRMLPGERDGWEGGHSQRQENFGWEWFLMDWDTCFIYIFFCSFNLASVRSVIATCAWRGTQSEMFAAFFGCFLKSTAVCGNRGFSERGDFVLSQPDLKPIEAIERLPSTALGFGSNCQRVPLISATQNVLYYVWK